MKRGLDDGLGSLDGVTGLEDARPHEHAVGAKLHHERRVCRGGDASRGEEHDGQPARVSDLLHQVVRGLKLLGRDVQLVLRHRGERADLPEDLAHVGDRVRDISGAGLALGPNHRRALGQPAQGFAEVCGAADEWHGELPLVDVIRVVGRRKHL